MKDKNIEYKINKSFGYYEVSPKLTEEELKNYYKYKYYQDELATYTNTYKLNELNYFKNKIAQKYFVIDKTIKSNKKNNLLDIGCGEGFTMDYYYKKGWNVLGLDFSDFGLITNNNHLKSHLLHGNVFDEIQNLVLKG